MARATSTTCAKGALVVEGDRPEVDDVEQRLHVVGDEVVDLALRALAPDALQAHPPGAKPGASFWKKLFPAMPSG
jgi:hypothetical protein